MQDQLNACVLHFFTKIQTIYYHTPKFTIKIRVAFADNLYIKILTSFLFVLFFVNRD